MSEYLVLLYQDERIWAEATEAESAEFFRQHREYSERAAEFGVVFLASEALQPVATAVTLRRAGEDSTVVDGPFAETAEQLGGFYLVTAADRESVLKHALLLPEYTIEVREIMQL
ncbi:YciI family protein [Cellulomonas sp. P5_C6]